MKEPINRLRTIAHTAAPKINRAHIRSSIHRLARAYAIGCVPGELLATSFMKTVLIKKRNQHRHNHTFTHIAGRRDSAQRATITMPDRVYQTVRPVR